MALLWALGLTALVLRRHAVTPLPPSPYTPLASNDAEPDADHLATAKRSGYLAILTAGQSVDLTTAFEARVAEVRVRAGEHVDAGAELVRLDLAAVREEVAIAVADERAARAEEARARAEAHGAAARLHRRRAPEAKGLLSPEELGTAVEQADAGRARLMAARARVAAARAKLQQRRTELAQEVLRAPFAGTVAARFADPGALIGPGKPALRLVGGGDYQARFAIPEADAARVRVDDAIVLVLTDSQLRLPGRVIAREPEIDTGSRMVLAVAQLALPDPAPELALGAVGRVLLSGEITDEKHDQTPTSARPLAVTVNQESDDVRPRR